MHTPEVSNRAKIYLAGGLGLLGAMLRWAGLGVKTDDFIYFLQPWFETLQNHPGLSAFQEPFSNYAPLYLYLLKILTWLPLSSLVSIKLLSILFDLALAAIAALIVKRLRPSAGSGDYFLVLALVWLAPTIFLNSAWWAQSDALYASLVLASFYLMIVGPRGRPWLAALLLGVALSFKIQAIFFLPILAGWLWSRRPARPGWWPLVLVPGVYLATLLPAWLAGGSLAALLTVYFHQASEYTALTLSAPTIFAFVEGWPLSETARTALGWLGGLAALATAFWLALQLKGGETSVPPRRLLLLSLLAAISIPFFLPRMHERYFYLADVFALVAAGAAPRRWYLPAGMILASLLAYAPYLSQFAPGFAAIVIDLRLAAGLVLLLLGSVAALVMHSSRTKTSVH